MFVEEVRHSETRPRKAIITPSYLTSNTAYNVELVETGRLIKRTKKERVFSLVQARKIARTWCQ